ncbi:MAG: DUF4132 domain-containing protein [Burkholderiales bacterium]|nr:DUF4132 domain-containing protein [Burkholderiales bacterium]
MNDARKFDTPAYDVPTIEWAAAIGPAAQAALDTLRRACNEEIARNNERNRLNGSEQYNKPLFSEEEFDKLRVLLAQPDPGVGTSRIFSDRYARSYEAMLLKFAAAKGVTPPMLVKTLLAFGGRWASFDDLWVKAFNTQYAASGYPTLLELQYLVQPYATPVARIFESCCSRSNRLALGWRDEDVWPFFVHNSYLFINFTDPRMRASGDFDPAPLYRVPAMLANSPQDMVEVVFQVAISNSRHERLAAQAALGSLPGIATRAVAALGDTSADIRTQAGLWLARLRSPSSQAALEQALAKERNDVAKGAILDALVALGQPVEKYFDRASLLREARKLAAKPVAADLAWFPWDVMPQVRWSGTGEYVDTDILRWLVVQAYKTKSAEPNGMLRSFCGMWDRQDGQAFGQFVLEAWLNEDLKPIDYETALQDARAQAELFHYYEKREAQNDPSATVLSIEEHMARLLPRVATRPAGSAASSKGVLAVAAACAGGRVAAPVARYVKDHYGMRGAQSKALLAMLAWIEDPSATQVMLSIGARFRTKSIQEEAVRLAEALAERRGWTVDELADRTIPTVGFDETATLELSYGRRSFTAVLLPNAVIELRNADGKKLAALPEPTAADDKDLAKEAKQALSFAKKEIKNIVALQTLRLYEALCTQRDWSYGDWDSYLNAHPVMRHLVQRLVWACMDSDGHAGQLFRPLADGTLTDCDDNEVKLSPDARIRVAHDSFVDAVSVAQWQCHLVDYKITPLFMQLGKGVHTLAAEQASSTVLTDFEGHSLVGIALRSRATKLGYARGASDEGGGWFFTYEKRFPSLGMKAVIEFTGCQVGNEDETVALIGLSFVAVYANGVTGMPIALQSVPPVLLSECYHDMRLMAADGTGYDANWRKTHGR